MTSHSPHDPAPGLAGRDVLYQHLARIGHAASNPHRLRLLGLLGQSEKTVERLAQQIGQSIAATSAHLKALRLSCLVETRRHGRNIHYRLASPSVSRFLLALRDLGLERLPEVREVVRDYFSDPATLIDLDARQLMREVRHGRVTLLDVRPPDEYAAGHLPGARSIPHDQLIRSLRRLPRRGRIVAYCRGPYCVTALQAVADLRHKGFKAFRLPIGVTDWTAAGEKLEVGAGA